ncbi:AIPR family protein [Bacillus altitudinis]|uniref:AIPR family protein n=1 Tax=Bacillus altitudinis TaxID=293387 RepID=UPI002D7954A5|nr:AIPR family protein [Bacillus altitudinis]WRO26654.1 AIPR family protein [Bacillus altitudinis]
MDRITHSMMQEFKESMEISNISDSDLFEIFSSYSIVSKTLDDTFDISDIVGANNGNEVIPSGIISGGGNDTGIDSIAITLNGTLITDLTEVEDIFNENNTIFEAVFVFIQSKTSSKFNGSEIRNFGDGIVDFLSLKPRLKQNNFIKNRWEIVNKIIDNASNIQNIICKVYYVTTGKWVNDTNLVTKIESAKADIDELNIFGSLEFIPVDADLIQNMYKESKVKLTQTVDFPKKVLLPSVNKVNEAYLGYIKIGEYINLIQDEAGNLRKSIFYDNIRDYQGKNPVNDSIEDTLSSDKSDRLVVLNNGVTIIADDIKIIRESITLVNYQIVNGCQTSYMIHFNKDKINPETYLPIKIIASKNDEIVTDIIIANNSQTEVKKEELIALTSFQKKLESYYASFTKKQQKLYYERRSKQYDRRVDIEKVRIVSISTQLRSFCGMFLDVPHMSSRYYGRLFKDYSERAFNDENNMLIYYTSAYALYKLEFYFRNKNLPKEFRKFKYHILMMLRYHVGGEKIPRFNSKSIETYCDKINQVMFNSQKSLEEFKYLISIIKTAVDDLMSNEITSKKSLNDILLAELKKKTSKI